MNVNIVSIAGRLTRDPNLKYTPSGKAVCEFSLAINNGWGDNQKVSYINVTTFGKTAESCGSYLIKGQLAHVHGRLQQDSWEKDGERRTLVKVIGNDVQFGPKSNGEGRRRQEEGSPRPPLGGEDNNDDIPF